MHFLRKKTDGKASLRGYMHTNWPQQKGEEKRVWSWGAKIKSIETFFETCSNIGGHKITCSRGLELQSLLLEVVTLCTVTDHNK